MAHVNLPKTNQTGVNEWADVQDNDDAIIAQLNGSLDATNLAANAVTTAKITDANVTDAKLASPNNSVYRTLLSATGFLGSGLGGATFILGTLRGGVNTPSMEASGSNIEDAQSPPPPFFQFVAADYTVASKTQKFRLRAQVACNGTAPAITFTFGLYPLTSSGAADGIILSLGTVVASSAVAIASPSGVTPTSAVNSDLTIPADGTYILGVATSGTIAVGSLVAVAAQLQTRSV